MGKRKYKKEIVLDYRYANSPDSEEILEQVFNNLFSRVIQKSKQLNSFLKSDEYREISKDLIERKSILADFLSPIDI